MNIVLLEKVKTETGKKMREKIKVELLPDIYLYFYFLDLRGEIERTQNKVEDTTFQLQVSS